MLTVEEVAKFFGVSAKTVRKWIVRGDLKAFKLRQFYRIKEAELQRFIQRNER